MANCAFSNIQAPLNAILKNITWLHIAISFFADLYSNIPINFKHFADETKLMIFFLPWLDHDGERILLTDYNYTLLVDKGWKRGVLVQDFQLQTFYIQHQVTLWTINKATIKSIEQAQFWLDMKVD